MVEFSGGCMCGAVRYEASGDPVRMVNCHCDTCRKITGSAFATNIFMKAEDVTVTQGETTVFEHGADSGNRLNKEFCPTCGSQIFSYRLDGPPLRGIKVGSIDDAGFVQPTANLYATRALHFTHISDDLINYDEMPT